MSMKLNGEVECRRYTIRLLDEDGRLGLIYEAMCSGNDDAMQRVKAIVGKKYPLFQITLGSEIVAKGART